MADGRVPIRIDIVIEYVYHYCMTTKLTLSINSDVVEKAKMLLQSKNQSLSGLVEGYFRLLIKTKQQRNVDTSVVKELTGIAKKLDRSEKQTIYEYLQEKYK
ncbi:MAG: hypothetical protein UT19_C0007G0077 [Candidatus Woesebacteria bacterium GW2011_GWB1_39_10b]|uniref:Antitoxin n=3 Tax=Candidatus Woeseibacteriota TaxID=1752722 RepID=A0A0G0NKC6_9BACT|nr:MAG: hypothetical protein US72_C0008G0034 [Microgenomates group bacterium GW2011_GWC1_38_12]KKQ93833.1 MAG: hypothetical protein UT19_C0007G0077 [Candidatus Woesebacteria bacterium GW2011_GWB1_39_10b]KKR13251.1 MAG: hypothetical protein UT40_C0021G0033 [Candidatus Woesebacteria bacterium GW2011_GWA1_39_21b]